MTQYAVIHVSKGKGNGGGLQKHIDRDTTPENADPAKSHLNKIDDYSHLGKTFGKRADTVIQQAGVKRKVRDDAVKYCPIILTGSHERMKEIEAEGQLERWAEECREFVESKWGKENVISFALHCDEKTPHIHAVIVPVVQGENKKGEKVAKLSAKELFGRKELTELQDIFALYMGDWGFERGREGSRAKHTTVQDFYKTLPERIEGMQKDIEGKTKELEELKALHEQYSAGKGLKRAVVGVGDRLLGNKAKREDEIKQLREQVNTLKSERDEAMQAVQSVVGGLDGLMNDVNKSLEKEGSKTRIHQIVEKGDLVYKVISQQGTQKAQQGLKRSRGKDLEL